MHRLAMMSSSTRDYSSVSSVSEPTAAEVITADCQRYQFDSKIQKELHQAVRDSIVAERILFQHSKKRERSSPQDVEEQRLARKQWALGNAALRKIAEEQNTLIELARQQPNPDKASKERFEMHPRLQQALTEAYWKSHKEQGLVHQVVSESTPDIDEFIQEQEAALTSLHRKLKKSKMTYHKQEYIVDFVLQQEKEMAAIQKKQKEKLPKSSYRLRAPMPPPDTRARPTRPQRTPLSKLNSFNDFIASQETGFQKAGMKKKATRSLKPEERTYLESFHRQPSPQQRQNPPSPSEASTLVSLSHLSQDLSTQLDDLQRPTPMRALQHSPEFFGTSITPLPATFQLRPAQQRKEPPPLLHDSPAATLDSNEKHPSIQYFDKYDSKSSFMPDITNTVVDREQFEYVRQHEEENNSNMVTIRRCLGMNEQNCCIRHPNRLVCEYTTAYKFDTVRLCKSCSYESPLSREEKTDISGDDIKLTDDQWMKQVLQRILQVQAWAKTPLKYNPICSEYFRMIQLGRLNYMCFLC
jgi:hypothetical protein